MALVTSFTCLKCGQLRYELYHPTCICKGCRKIILEVKRKEHFAIIDSLTPEQRLRKVEEELYDTKADDRLRELEARTARF